MSEILEKLIFLFGMASLFSIVPGGLLVSLFSQTVHRKFRKNKDLAPYMGATGSGFVDVLIFTGIFGLPISITRWLHRRHPYKFISDPDVILPHATRYDKVVGFLAYWTFRCAIYFVLLSMACDYILKSFFL